MTPVLKWIYLGACILEAAGFLAYLSANASYTDRIPRRDFIHGHRPNPFLHDLPTQASLAVFVLSLVIARGAALTWLGMAWATIPEADRVNARGDRVSVDQAVGLMFVPIYGLYWMFAANLSLCDAHDRLADWFELPTRAPRGVAISACVSTLVPYVSLVVSPILWVTYTLRVEAMKRELAERAGPSA